MRFYDPVTGQPHDFIVYAEDGFVKSKPASATDAQQYGWLPDDRPDVVKIREDLLARFTGRMEGLAGR